MVQLNHDKLTLSSPQWLHDRVLSVMQKTDKMVWLKFVMLCLACPFGPTFLILIAEINLLVLYGIKLTKVLKKRWFCSSVKAPLIGLATLLLAVTFTVLVAHVFWPESPMLHHLHHVVHVAPYCSLLVSGCLLLVALITACHTGHKIRDRFLFILGYMVLSVFYSYGIICQYLMLWILSMANTIYLMLDHGQGAGQEEESQSQELDSLQEAMISGLLGF
jgi:hypothetical protein